VGATALNKISNWLDRILPGRQKPAFVGQDRALTSVRYVVVDTELTSLDRRSNRILSIGAIAMEGPSIRIGEQFYSITNPGVTVPVETILIHGLRPVDVLEGVAPHQAINEFLRFARGAVLVGHFLSIDLAALKKENNGDADLFANPAIDTYRVQRWLDLRRNAYKGDRGHQMESVDLASLAGRYGIEMREAHHALYDALITAELWQRLIFELKIEGLQTLRHALRVGKALK
jgi:DNA polymerase III subunit epsilon